MKIIETFNDFVTACADYADTDVNLTGHRVGQRAFNLLSHVRSDLATMVTGSDFDPFYDDSRLCLFYDFVMRHWNDGECKCVRNDANEIISNNPDCEVC